MEKEKVQYYEQITVETESVPREYNVLALGFPFLVFKDLSKDEFSLLSQAVPVSSRCP